VAIVIRCCFSGHTPTLDAAVSLNAQVLTGSRIISICLRICIAIDGGGRNSALLTFLLTWNLQGDRASVCKYTFGPRSDCLHVSPPILVRTLLPSSLLVPSTQIERKLPNEGRCFYPRGFEEEANLRQGQPVSRFTALQHAPATALKSIFNSHFHTLLELVLLCVETA
jgi:hypothetical protein